MKQFRKKMSYAEWLIISSFVCFEVLLITPPHMYLTISWILTACSFGGVLFTSTKFYKFKRTIFMIAFLYATYLTYTAELNPLQSKITGGQFVDVPLSDVLYHFSKQRENRPSWNFTVYGNDLCVTKVSLLIPDGITLGEALDEIAQTTGCQYQWHRYRLCGNDPGPGSIMFVLSKRGADRNKDGTARIIVNRVGVLACNNSGCTTLIKE